MGQITFSPRHNGLRIWQYQDFVAPVSASLTLTAFENGTGLVFNSGYIINSSAVVTQTDVERPPTTTTNILTRWLPANRVSVLSHSGTNVTLNQIPAVSMDVRVWFLLQLPSGIREPDNYQEAPQFVNEARIALLDEAFVNQYGDEAIYGVKTFDSKTIFNDSVNIEPGVGDLPSPVDGDIWYNSSTGKFRKHEGGVTSDLASAGVIDHGLLTGLTDDDHAQYALLAGRSGGQTLNGSTLASENLTLSSTAHATKNRINFGAAATSYFDEVNNDLFIANKVNVAGSSTVNDNYVNLNKSDSFANTTIGVRIRLNRNANGAGASIAATRCEVINAHASTLATMQGIQMVLTNQTASSVVTNAFGLNATLTNGSTSQLDNVRAIQFTMTNNNTGTDWRGLDITYSSASTGELTDLRFVRLQLSTMAGLLTNLYGISLAGWSTPSGTITNTYAIYADTTIDVGTTRYFIYSLSTNPSHMVGKLGLGSGNTAPTARLQVRDTVEPLRLEYDASNYMTAILGATGAVTFNAVGAGASFAFQDAVDIQGSLQCDSIVNDTGLAAGVYTPTRSAEANMDGNVTMFEAQYMRVGNTVTVSGRFTANPTLAATATSFEMTLPVASNISAAEDVAGVAFCGSVAGMGAAISGSVANDTAVVAWVSSDINSNTWSFQFSYQVI